MKQMKVLVTSLLILTPWVMRSMEPEEVKTKEVPAETLAKLLEQRRGRWVTSVEEVLPGDIPTKTATRMSQVIAQEILLKGPPIRQFILSQVSQPFKDCVGHTDFVTSAVFNPTGDKVVTGSDDTTARIWDTETGTLLNTLEGHTNWVWSAMFNPTGNKVVTGSHDGTARIWDPETGTLLNTLEGHTGFVNSAMFNPTGNKVVTGSNDGTARIWDPETGTLLRTLEGHTGAVNSAVFNPTTGNKILTASDDTTARIWDTETGTLLHILEGHTDDVTSAVFNPTGDKVVTASRDTTARIWDTETGTLLNTLEGHTDDVISAVFNPTGDKVVTASRDDTARIWDTETGTLIHTLEGHTHIVDAAVFDPAGDKIVTASADRTARIWDLGPLLKSHEFLAEDITLRQVAILNDIFELMKAQGIVKVLKEKTFEKVAPLVSLKVTFDFNHYPHLWDDYESMPEAIRTIFDPYVTKLSSSTQEQQENDKTLANNDFQTH